MHISIQHNLNYMLWKIMHNDEKQSRAELLMAGRLRKCGKRALQRPGSLYLKKHGNIAVFF